MSCGLRHLASATGRAEGAALAREWEDHVRRAGRAADAAEAEGWVAALEERLELLRHVTLVGVAVVPLFAEGVEGCVVFGLVGWVLVGAVEEFVEVLY